MYNYNCPECEETKIKTDKNTRKINEVIGQVNELTPLYNDTENLIESKANEKVEEVANVKVPEMVNNILDEVITKTENIINIKLYGAKGDGVTDDIQVFKNAIDHLKTLNGGKIYVPLSSGSVYCISETLVLTDKIEIEFQTGYNSQIALKPIAGGNYINNYMILINSWDGVESASASPVGNKYYKGIQFYNLNGEEQIVEGLKGIFCSQEHCIFKDITSYGLNNTIVFNEKAYLDNEQIRNCYFYYSKDYPIVKVGQGDGLTIENCKVYGELNGLKDKGWRLAKVDKTYNLTVSNCINGTIEILNSTFNILNSHLEMGNIIINNSKGSVRDFIIFHSSYNDYTPIEILSGSDVLLSNGEICITPIKHNNDWNKVPYEINAECNNLKIENVFKTVIIDEATKSKCGIKINSSNTYLRDDFNYNSSQLSSSCTINQNMIKDKIHTSNGEINKNDVITVTVNPNNPYAWNKAEGTYYYLAMYLHGGVNPRMITCELLEKNPDLSTRALSITPKNEYLHNNTVLRLFRGTKSGIYTEYVDIPLVGMTDKTYQIIDTGSHCMGYGWNSGTFSYTALIEDVNVIESLEFYCGYTGNHRVGYASGQPTKGTWFNGDIIFNTTPSDGTDRWVYNDGWIGK